MKNFTKTNLLLAGLSLVTLTFQAQDQELKSVLKNNAQMTGRAAKLLPNTDGTSVIQQAGQKSAALTNCTDKIDYVGSTPGPYYLGIGGPTVTPNIHLIGVFQVYPSYTGSVVGIEFTASKYNVVANPKVYVGIFGLNSFGDPVVSAQQPTIPAVPFITLASTSSSLCSVTFANPVQVSNGFAIGIYVLGQDSAKIIAGPLLGTSAPVLSYVYDTQPGMFTVDNYYGVNSHVLAKPIVTTSVNPTWLSAKTNTGCGIPAVYEFTNTTSSYPSYVGDVVINPSGITEVLDYGDGSPTVPNFSGIKTHSYTALGTHTANFTQTYVGWTNNCVETQTVVVTVDNPQPSFTYNTNGLTVMFTNTSQNLSSYSWNFGDLATSTQTDPTHTFSSPGTYVVELEGTAPCGKVKYTLSITVSAGTGITKNTLSPASISLFPNPANNTLNVSYAAGDKLDSKIEIYNTLGAVIKTSKTDFASGKASMDVSDLSKGMYFMKIKTTQGEVVKSFVKE